MWRGESVVYEGDVQFVGRCRGEVVRSAVRRGARRGEPVVHDRAVCNLLGEAVVRRCAMRGGGL